MNSSVKKTKPHYAWVILISCCLVNASALGLSNSNGLFYPQICAELGVPMSALSLHTIVCGLSSAVTLFWVDKAYKKFNTRLILIASLLTYHLSYMSMSVFHSVTEFCIASVFTGIASAFLYYIPIPMLIGNWFVKFRKTALSICFVACGISGILCSLLLGWTITTFGWRMSYLIRGMLLLIVALPVLLIRKTPEELGCRAYGADENGSDGSGSRPEPEEKVFGESAGRQSFELKRIRFVFAIFVAVSMNLSCGMTQQLPNYAASIGLGVVMGSVLTSLAMAGNIASKAAFGPLTEKFGVVKVTVCLLVLMSAGWLLPGLGVSGSAVVCAASMTTGISACVNTLVIPNLADTFVKGDEYIHVLARCSTGTMLASAFSLMISSSLHDLFGSYTPVFLCYIGLLAVNIAVLIIVFGKNSFLQRLLQRKK